MNKKNIKVNKLCLSAMFLALGWLLPFLSGQIPQVGNMLCLMHIPVFLAGFILGPWYGLGLGFITPLSRFLVFGMPVFYPTGICMAFELATYGFLSGFLYKLFKKLKFKDIVSIFLSLIISMLLGRVIWGISRLLCGVFDNNAFTFKLFITMGFVNAWPGIILQLLLIPSLIRLLENAHLLDKYQGENPNELSTTIKDN